MKQITLSFDNGPDPEITPFVLDVLARHDVRASFFVIGDKLRDPARRAVCERAHSEGHWIGNHTFHHLTPLGLGRHKGGSSFEIGRTQELLGDLAHDAKFFRPFGGGGNINADLLDEEAYAHLLEGGYTCVLWNLVPRDWEQPDLWPEIAFQKCAGLEHPLLVLHDLMTGAMDRLESFIVSAREGGMSFVQDFPDSCVPMRCGIVGQDMSAIVSSMTGHSAPGDLR